MVKLDSCSVEASTVEASKVVVDLNLAEAMKTKAGYRMKTAKSMEIQTADSKVESRVSSASLKSVWSRTGVQMTDSALHSLSVDIAA